ncbi:hypothetical protein GGE07_005685 [Sinorhizobium terangae]|nr:hypothetical protein [Sinorhizobium terangae]
MSCCQSRLLRAKRDTSRAATAPTCPGRAPRPSGQNQCELHHPRHDGQNHHPPAQCAIIQVLSGGRAWYIEERCFHGCVEPGRPKYAGHTVWSCAPVVRPNLLMHHHPPPAGNRAPFAWSTSRCATSAVRAWAVPSGNSCHYGVDAVFLLYGPENSTNWHGHLSDSLRARPMLAPISADSDAVAISSTNAFRAQKLESSTCGNRSNIHAGTSRDRTDKAPERLQRKTVSLQEHLMDMNQTPGPGMPRI